MIIALNNKCNLNKEEFYDYLTQLRNINLSKNIILCPSSINISQVDINEIFLGAQNVSKTQEGAYTGELSAKQLKSYNVNYCIVGHSERREYQKESNEDINNKIKQLYLNDITPILCIGETKEEKESNKTFEVLKEELLIATKELSENEKEKLIVAYEPIWSIGTGIIPTLEEIDKNLMFIKTILPNSKLLYGGSANEENIDILKQSRLIDGFLLGGLSLKVEKLESFIKKLN